MSGRVEIITGPERRQRWSDEEKLQLVAEACQFGGEREQTAYGDGMMLPERHPACGRREPQPGSRTERVVLRFCQGRSYKRLQPRG
jgi:hypothetical protein